MLTPEIREKCLNDPQLLANIAKVTSKTPRAAIQMVFRNSSKELLSVHVLKEISEYTGLTQEQILSPKKVEA